METIDTGFPTHKFQLDPDWIINLMNREDSDDRIIAFYESIHNAFVTDGEDWDHKGRDVLIALLTNNATALLVALCGWGPDKLAQLAFLKHSTSQFTVQTLEGKLIVEWSDGCRYSTPCMICSKQNLVFSFDQTVFAREDKSDTKIAKTWVRFSPLQNSNQYDFLCMSQTERDAVKDEDVFWYATEVQQNE